MQNNKSQLLALGNRRLLPRNEDELQPQAYVCLESQTYQGACNHLRYSTGNTQAITAQAGQEWCPYEH